MFLVLLLAVGIPAAWSVDTDAIVDGAGQLMRGVKVGNVTISLGNVGMAIVAFVVCIVMARLVRSIVRDRVLPTVDAPLPLRQSIDAGLNYIGVLLALVIGIAVLGVDFTNLAIVLGALSVGIGLGLQNIANNVISGVILLVERPIKAGDWVIGGGPRRLRPAHQHPRHRDGDLPAHPRHHAEQHVPAESGGEPHLCRHVEPGRDQAHGRAGDRRRGDGRPAARGGAQPSARAARAAADRALRAHHAGGLEFELYVFVNRLEDRLVVTNDLNRAILARLIEARIVDPNPVPTFKLQGLETPLGAAGPPVLDSAAGKDGDAAASP